MTAAVVPLSPRTPLRTPLPNCVTLLVCVLQMMYTGLHVDKAELFVALERLMQPANAAAMIVELWVDDC